MSDELTESREAHASLLQRANDAVREVIANPREGRLLAQLVAADARAVGETEALTVSLRASAWAARELYEHGEARRLVNDAVRVARGAGLKTRLAEALLTRSTIQLEEGRIGSARRDLLAARADAPMATLAEIAFTTGLVEDRAGDFEAAAAAYDEAIQRLDNQQPDLRTKALVNRALIAVDLGDHGLSERYLDEALELAQTFSPAFAAIVAHNRALVATQGGQPIEGLRRYAQAEEMLRAAQLPLVEHYLEKAQALLALRLLAEAAAATGLAIEELRSPGAALLLAEALVLESRIAQERDFHNDAAQSAQAAAELFRAQRRPGWRATAELMRALAQFSQHGADDEQAIRLSRIRTTMIRMGDVPGTVSSSLLEGKVLRAIGKRRKALGAFDRAAKAAAAGPVLMRMQGRLAAALGAEMTDDGPLLSRSCRLGLGELEQYRASFASAELHARAAGHGVELAQVGLRAATRSGRPDRIWSWLERTRAVALSPAVSGPPQREVAPLLAEMRTIHGQLDGLSPDAAMDKTQLLRRLARVEGRIRELTWQRRASTVELHGTATGEPETGPRIGVAPTQRSLDILQRELEGRVLLEYGHVDGDMVAVAVGGERRTFKALGPAEDVTAATTVLGMALRRLTRPGSAAALGTAMANAHLALDRLDDLLISPFAKTIAGSDETVVVPPGDLIGVPWSALPRLRDQPVRVAPSATAWWITASRHPSSARVVAVAGPGLEAAEQEAAAVAALHPRSRVLAPAAATCEAVLDVVAGAQLVHLACHGILRSDSPTFSAFRMADGPLTVHDLEGLILPVHHWILAACDLGDPGRLAGPDLEGVLAALFASGAGAVVAAVVPVPDTATTVLMTALHERLRVGDSLAQGLRTAKLSIDDTEPLPFVVKTAFGCYGGG